MKTLINNLKQANQDFEFYPTTKTMIKTILDDFNNSHFSMLDIGAGNGNVFNIIDELNFNDKNGYTKYLITKYAIEKSKLLIQAMPEDIFVIGTDFHYQTLIDKKVDIIFCNPPYKEYVFWTEKIIKEANTKIIYLIIPQRWKNQPQILEAIKKRTKDNHKGYEVLGSFDFEDSEFRQSRAKIDIVKITLQDDNSYRGERLEVDPFDLWFDENFKINADKKTEYDYEDTQKRADKIHELAKGQNLIERLEELYQKDLKDLLDTYKSIENLNADILKELDINVEGVKKGLKLKIEGLKNLYWQELFNNMTVLTNKLTFDSRKNMLETLTSHTQIDFTIDNAYAVVIWAIKNTNKYIDNQLCQVYKEMTEPKNVINYKSNKKMIDDSWRYSRHNNNHTHYVLDYRIVCERCICFNPSSYGDYGYPNGLSKNVHNFLSDICVIGKNLGFDVLSSSMDFQWNPGEENYFKFYNNNQSEIFMKVRTYKKGTVHLKINQEFMKAFNIEAARLNGWIKSPQDIINETDINSQTAIKYFKTNCQLLLVNIKLLNKEVKS